MELDATSFCILIVALEVFMLNSLVVPVTSASPKGFVSINCGAPGGWDPVTTLDWDSDRKYLQAADQLAKLGVTVSANVTLAPSTTPVDNAERLETALVFYPGSPGARLPRSKYCYNLSVEYNSTGRSKNYLLRATFPSRNLKARDINGELISFSAYTTRFYFSVDSTYISTVDLDELQPQTIELIIPSLDTNVYVCLVPLEDRSSMPAISALELRPLSDGMYARSSSGVYIRTAYLITISRLNFGGDPELPSLRYPSDKYDRLWSSPPIPSFQSADVKFVTNISYVNASNQAIIADIDPPETVMSTAWEGRSLESNITFQWNLTKPRPQRPMLTFHANILVYDVLDTSNATRFIDVYCDEREGIMTWFLDWGINEFWSHLWVRNWFSHTGDVLSCTLSNNGSSDLPAMINMAEMYGELNYVVGRTLKEDAVAVGEFALEFPDHVDGSGDPCMPVPWAWIVCSMEVPSRVTQINLTSKDIGGNFPTAFGKLNRLMVLDLSNNNFRGSVPRSLGDISALRALNVERNELTGELPIFSSQSLPNLEFLSLSSNRISGNLTSLVSALDDTLSVLDVSNNSFTGNIPQMERLTNMQKLDLSNNQLSGEVGLNLVRLKNLRTLNLNNNHLGGRVPDNLWSASNLAEANLNGNMFTELDLTTWYKSVMEERSFNAEKSRRKVRLVGNQIHTVILPSLPPLETKITSPPTEDKQKETLENPAAFILLAGNPWCEGRGEPNTSLLERYLCRSDERQDFWSPLSGGQGGLSRTTVIIVILICALVVTLVLCLSALLLRRMWRRTHELHQIQEALAKEHVKPPFFNYEDLRSATQNFSTNSILGRGGFGTVYKADLADGSILAVKKLNPTEQNTSDFLKEMVNISGIKHRHLIQLKGCCVREKKQRMLVYEYAENRSLAEALWGPGSLSLSWKHRFNICLGIARGLAYLHDELQPKMVHRDIKPQNILLDKDYNAKIADFGLVRPAEADNRTQITLTIGGTRGYCSPEYFSEGVISEKLDVFSYGIVLLEIVSGRVCIDCNLQGQQMYLRTWAMELYEQNKLLSMVDMKLTGENNEEEVLLILRTALACCQLDSKNRPTMSQVVNLLMKQQADVALDIVTELKRQRSGKYFGR